jgi:hypothetical protein
VASPNPKIMMKMGESRMSPMAKPTPFSAQVEKDLRTPDGIRVYPALPFLRELV